jgi:hypothetical protein
MPNDACLCKQDPRHREKLGFLYSRSVTTAPVLDQRVSSTSTISFIEYEYDEKPKIEVRKTTALAGTLAPIGLAGLAIAVSKAIANDS